MKSNKFTFGTPWLSDLLRRHWFTPSVWNFCRWSGADVPPGETSIAARSKEKRLYSQTTWIWAICGARKEIWTRDWITRKVQLSFPHYSVLLSAPLHPVCPDRNSESENFCQTNILASCEKPQHFLIVVQPDSFSKGLNMLNIIYNLAGVNGCNFLPSMDDRASLTGLFYSTFTLAVLITALFTNMRNLKFKSRLQNCVFRCRQS